jgi:FixJ family two-component response regulator
MQAEPTVFIVDQNQTMCDDMAAALSLEGVRVESHTTIQAMLTNYVPSRPGCLVLNIGLPGINDIEPLSQFIVEVGDCFLVLVASQLTGLANMSAGAIDVLHKPVNPDLLRKSVSAALERDTAIRNHVARQQKLRQQFDDLAAREREVLELVVEGNPTKRIAAELGSSFHTVRNQRASILRKLNVESSIDLVCMVASINSD